MVSVAICMRLGALVPFSECQRADLVWFASVQLTVGGDVGLDVAVGLFKIAYSSCDLVSKNTNWLPEETSSQVKGRSG